MSWWHIALGPERDEKVNQRLVMVRKFDLNKCSKRLKQVKFRNCCFAPSWEEIQVAAHSSSQITTEVRCWDDISPNPVDIAVDICLQVWHPPAPVDQEQTNTETGEVFTWRCTASFWGLPWWDHPTGIPEDNFEDGPGEIAPEADIAEAKGLHDLVQVLHVLPAHFGLIQFQQWSSDIDFVTLVIDHLPQYDLACSFGYHNLSTTKTTWYQCCSTLLTVDFDKFRETWKIFPALSMSAFVANLLIFSTSSRCKESSTSNS